jgi:glycine betaine transporter
LTQNLKLWTFGPSAILQLVTLIITWQDPQSIVQLKPTANGWIIQNLAHVFTFSALIMVVISGYVFFSAAGGIGIGSPDAEVIFTPFRWFVVSLTT